MGAKGQFILDLLINANTTARGKGSYSALYKYCTMATIDLWPRLEVEKENKKILKYLSDDQLLEEINEAELLMFMARIIFLRTQPSLGYKQVICETRRANDV